MTSTVSSVSPVHSPDYSPRTRWLCAPSWGAALWLLVLFAVHELHLMPLQKLVMSKPVITLASTTTIFGPLCWAAALFFARQSVPTRKQKVVLAISGVATAITWIVLIYFIRKH